MFTNSLLPFISTSNSKGLIPADSPCLIFITLPPSCLHRLAYSPSTSRKNTLQLSVPLHTIFRAALTFNATDLPPPLVPHIKVCGLGREGGPINVFIYTGALVNKFLPINIPIIV